MGGDPPPDRGEVRAGHAGGAAAGAQRSLVRGATEALRADVHQFTGCWLHTHRIRGGTAGQVRRHVAVLVVVLVCGSMWCGGGGHVPWQSKGCRCTSVDVVA